MCDCKDIKLTYNSVPLTITPFYNSPDYNNLRRMKIICFGDKLNNYDIFKNLGYD